MGLLGNGWDDPKSSAIMALSGGLLKGDFGGGLLGANDAFRQAKQDAAKQQFMKMQMDNYASEIEQRKAAVQKQQNLQALMERYLGGGGSAPAAPGQLGSGSFGVMPPPAGMPDIPQSQPAGSRIGSIPPDVLALMKAQGLDLVDVAKFARPDMQVSNGYAYDKNSVSPGFLPFVKAADNGQVTVGMPGADGQLSVKAPPGALETYREFRQADEAAKAGSDLVKVYNPATQREEFVTRSQALRATQPAQTGNAQLPSVPAQPGMRGSFVGTPEAVMASIEAIRDPQERANALAAFQEQARRTPGFGQGAAFAAGPSTQETIRAAADKERAVKQAGADVLPTAQRQNSIAQANYLTSVIDMALDHPGRQTATGASGTFDPRNYLPGTDATDFKAVLGQIKGSAFLQAFEGLKGGGQITEVEGEKATNAIARLNTAQSDDEFERALKDLRQVVQNGLTRAKANMKASNGATGSFDGDNSEMVKPKNVVPTLPKTAAKGTRARDTATGETLEFNGLSWVKVK